MTFLGDDHTIYCCTGLRSYPACSVVKVELSMVVRVVDKGYVCDMVCDQGVSSSLYPLLQMTRRARLGFRWSSSPTSGLERPFAQTENISW